MKVLLAVPRLNIGGAESYVFTLATGLKKRGIDVVIMSGGGYLADALARAGCKHYFCPMRLSRRLAAQRMAHIIKREQIQLVHANSTAAALPASTACADLKIPWVMTAHGVFGSDMAAAGINRANRVICVSDFLKQSLVSATGMDAALFTTIYNGIDLGLFRPDHHAGQDLRSEWGLGRDNFVVGTVSRLGTTNGKGHYSLLHAMAGQSGNEAWKLLIVGKGSAKWRIQLKALREGVGRRVKFAGHRTDVPAVMASCDAIVLASRFETFGLVLAEGMALGKPVIAYSVGGTTEVIENGVSGFLVPYGDIAGMMSLIDRLSGDRELCDTLGRNGRKRVEALFDSALMTDQIIAVYKDVLHNEVNPSCS
jgi:glycosyltransferase involved in cell wall biosynthesis